MATQQEPSARSRAVAGVLAIAISTPMFLIGFGVIEPEPHEAPAWMGFVCGLAFALAGASILLGAASPQTGADGALPSSSPLWLRALQLGCSLGVVAMLALTASWIAFGAGERHFSASVGGISGAGDEGVGRFVFGGAALLLWLMLWLFARAGLRRLKA